MDTEIWFIAIAVAGVVYLLIFGTMLSKRPTQEKVVPLGWPTFAGFLLYLLLVAIGLWAFNLSDAAAPWFGLALGFVLTIPGCVALSGYTKGFRDGLRVGEDAWRRAAVELMCTCRESLSTNRNTHDPECKYRCGTFHADNALHQLRQRHPDDVEGTDWLLRPGDDGLSRSFFGVARDLVGGSGAIVVFAVLIVVFAALTVGVLILVSPAMDWIENNMLVFFH